ncbi:MAG: acyl-CoA dehydrogenase family protein [Thermoanaerobaculia bacterium]
MDFTISEKMQTTLEMIREFVGEKLHPIEFLFLNQPFRELLPRIEEKRALVKKMGLWAPGHPAEHGGMGLGLVDYGLVSEALGGSPLGHFVFGCHAPDAGNIEILHLHGTEDQKARWLQPLVEGEIRSCFSMTEVEMPGSNPVLMETTAIGDGDDYVINGRKWYTTAADGAAVAVVMAVTEPKGAPHERASMILVPTDTPGFEIVRNIAVMGEAREDWPSHSEVAYRDCRVPKANRLGEAGRGFVIAQERLGPGRIHHCMRWLGICRRAFDLLCERAASRPIARGKVLADKEIVQGWIAESAAEIEAARALTLETAWKIDQEGWKAAREEISMIKFLVADTMLRVIDRALQAHGGLGMTDDTPLAFWYRHERAARIYDGPDEAHKQALARRILKRYR